MIPDYLTAVEVKAETIAETISDLNVIIRLESETLALLEKVAGPTLDPRFIIDIEDIDFDNESWAWTINWYPESDSKTISLWFKDPKHAVYFKMLWGGQ